MEGRTKVSDAKAFRENRRSDVKGDSVVEQATWNRIAIIAGAALLGFFLGFVPLWLTSTGYQQELRSVVKTLRPSVLQNELATATINARRGEFEQARQQTSSFFSELRSEVGSAESAFVAEQGEAMKSILEQRDDTITLLARNDPASADRLTEIYFNYLQIKNSSASDQR